MESTRLTSKAVISDDDDLINQYSGSGSGNGNPDTATTTSTTTSTTTTTTTTANRATNGIRGIKGFPKTDASDVGTRVGPAPLPPSEGKGADCIPIVAAAAGGALFVLLIIVVIVILCRRRRRKKNIQPKEIADSKPPSYHTAIEMSAADRSTHDVRPVKTGSELYSASESEQNYNSLPSHGEKCFPSTDYTDQKSPSKVSNGQSKLDASSKNDDEEERYSHLSSASPTAASVCNKYEPFHDHENSAAGNQQSRMSTEVSENPYDDIGDPTE